MNRYTERKLILGWLSTAVTLLILLVLLMDPAYACEDSRHAYLTIGAGKQGEWMHKDGGEGWDGENALAAMFTVGARAPMEDWLWIGGELGHHSHWDQGCPQDCDEGESSLDYLKVYIELRMY